MESTVPLNVNVHVHVTMNANGRPGESMPIMETAGGHHRSFSLVMRLPGTYQKDMEARVRVGNPEQGKGRFSSFPCHGKHVAEFRIQNCTRVITVLCREFKDNRIKDKAATLSIQ
jgi:hypothetical protein